MLPAKPTAPVAGTSFVNWTTSGSKPSLAKLTVMSALRLATMAQGVTHAVGTSRPEMVASAPDGVDEMLIFSVVPRVTDAQPTPRRAPRLPKHALIDLPKPGGIQPQPEGEINSNRWLAERESDQARAQQHEAGRGQCV